VANGPCSPRRGETANNNGPRSWWNGGVRDDPVAKLAVVSLNGIIDEFINLLLVEYLQSSSVWNF